MLTSSMREFVQPCENLFFIPIAICGGSLNTQMEPSKPRIPDLQVQSLAVDFIDNHLDKYHPAFSTPHARYDPAQGSFVAVPTPRLGSPPMQSPDKQQPSAMRQRDDMTLSPRSLADPANALKFWDSLFVRAMKKFAVGPKATKEPAGRAQAGFSIRDKTSWTAIFKTLQSAQESYFRTKGIKGAARIGYRAFADHAAPLLLDVTNLVPETGCVFVTPVVGSIQIVLEVTQLSHFLAFLSPKINKTKGVR